MPHRTSQIRNVALVGHGGVGKTTVAEAMLHAAGVTSRAGRVDDGTSVLDREPEEIDRRSIVSLALASFDWNNGGGEPCRVNLLDTPGHPDFEAEVNAALAVADLAVIVVSATDGVEIGTARRLAQVRRARPAADVLRHSRRQAPRRLRRRASLSCRPTFGARRHAARAAAR